MAKLKNKLIKAAELILEFAGLCVAIFIMGLVLVYQGIIWGYKKVGGKNAKG